MRLNSPKINIIHKSCLRASKSMIRDFGEIEKLQVSAKGPGDFVSAADKKSEEIIIEELLKAYPKNKKIQRLKGIELFVADTHNMSTSEIHRKLNYMYKNKSKSIVYTSRLLYRAWSQVQLDSVYFADNFKGVSYIVQALGRGLRTNPDKPNKICRVYVPVDIDNDEPWKILLDLIGSIKGWDYRPMESILNLATSGRNAGKRQPGGGQVFINNYGAGGGVELPFGGVGKSGHGREKGFEALYGFSTLKTIAAFHG